MPICAAKCIPRRKIVLHQKNDGSSSGCCLIHFAGLKGNGRLNHSVPGKTSSGPAARNARDKKIPQPLAEGSRITSLLWLPSLSLTKPDPGSFFSVPRLSNGCSGQKSNPYLSIRPLITSALSYISGALSVWRGLLTSQMVKDAGELVLLIFLIRYLLHNGKNSFTFFPCNLQALLPLVLVRPSLRFPGTHQLTPDGYTFQRCIHH